MIFKINFLFFLIFISFNSSADVKFTPNKSIILSGKTCEELNTYAKGILKWKKTIVKNYTEELPACYCSTTGCRINIFKISPAFVQDNTSFLRGENVSSVDGPNCFNTALQLSGTVTRYRFVHSDEVKAIYESPLCRELELAEEMVPGDIIAVKDQSNKFFNIHAAVYVSEKLMYSKQGFSNVIPSAYSTTDYKVYKVTDDCQRIKGAPSVGTKCYNRPFSNIYRCKSFSSYISSLGNFSKKISGHLVKLYRLTSKVETSFSSSLKKRGSKIKLKVRNDYISRLVEIDQLLEEIEAVKSTFTLTEKTFHTLMLTRFKSLDQQLSYLLKK